MVMDIAGKLIAVLSYGILALLLTALSVAPLAAVLAFILHSYGVI